MRRFSPVSEMWQSVFVRPDGSGVLTSLIGEIAGAPQRHFRLSSSRLERLRHLIATARDVRSRVSGPGDYVYSLHIGGEPPLSLEGKLPKRLSPLVAFLGKLMLTYCC